MGAGTHCVVQTYETTATVFLDKVWSGRGQPWASERESKPAFKFDTLSETSMPAGSRYVFCWFFSNIGQSRETLSLDQLRPVAWKGPRGPYGHALGNWA